jgi:hypothetical protein
MWKVVAAVIAIVVLAHFGMRYVRSNPLGPHLEGSEIAVESKDYSVRFQQNGAFGGTYFVSDAQSSDWGKEVVNLRLHVFEPQTAREYMHSYPDFHRYGSDSSLRVAPVALPLSLIAANRQTYGDLRALLDRHQPREADGGERLCVTVGGESLSVASARSLDDGHDETAMVSRMSGEGAIVYVDHVDLADCSVQLAEAR